nr:MAG TPA: hypothetical protein [Caudoviricetes sp.]
MEKGKAVRQLKSMRKEAEDHLLHEARDGDAADSIWARDIEALTAGIQALSAQGPDRAGWLRRGSKMLDQILGIVADMAGDDERPMFESISDYWRKGRNVATPIERVALDAYRQDWRIGENLGKLNKARTAVSRVGLLLLEDVYPESGGEEGADDENA